MPLSASDSRPDLGARITLRHTAIELPGGDRGGGLLDFDQRPQAAVHHRDSRRRRAPTSTASADADLRPDQRANGRLNVGQVDGDGGQLAVRRRAPTPRATATLEPSIEPTVTGIGTDVVVGRQRGFGVAVVDGHPDAAVGADAADVEVRRRTAGVRALDRRVAASGAGPAPSRGRRPAGSGRRG